MAQEGEVRQHPNGGTYKREGGIWVLQGAALAPAASGGVVATIAGPGKAPPPQTPVQAAMDAQQLENARLEAAKKRRELAKPDADMASDPKLKESENTAAFLTTRLAGSLDEIEDAARRNKAAESPSVGTEVIRALPLGGQYFARKMTPADRQIIEDAQMNALDAALTLGTGAAYTKEQLAGYAQSYFPQIGDKPDTIAAKRKRFATLLEAAKLKAGNAAPQIDQALARAGVLYGEDPVPLVSGGGVGAFGDQISEDVPGRQMTSEQQAAYDALVSTPGVTADQLRSFGDKIGFRIENADEIIKARDEGIGVRTSSDTKYNVPEATTRLKEFRDRDGGAGATDLLVQGATLGLSDEAAGVGNALANAIMSPFSDTEFDPVGAYQAGKGSELLRLRDARNALGGVGTAVEIGGGLLSGNPSSAIAAGGGVLRRIGTGAKAGAAGGALGGYGYGEGLEGSALSAAGGAALGGTVGAAIPFVGSVASNRVQGLRRFLGRDPDLPRRLVGEAIAADGNTPRLVGEVMDAARGRGSPLALADTGENARGLLASVGRQPGPAKTLTRRAMIERQQAQFERVASAVRRDLGATVNIRERSDELIEAARTAATPLYDAFRAASRAGSVKLDDLQKRPAFRKAMRNALDLAAEEGVDPTSLGFDFDEAGDVVFKRVPSWETLDYVKRGMDDVVEGFRDSTTGKLNLNTGQARATNATLRTLISRMDAINKNYAPARAAYAGPARMRDALQKGSKALNRAPDDLLAEMKGMGEPEREMYRMGLRKSIVDMMASRVDGGDKVAALIGTPKKRAALMQAFGGRQEFDNFIATLRDEEAMGQTYRAVATGSPTAERMAADATTNDTGLTESAMDAALRGGKDGMWSALVSAFQKLREVDRFGPGQAGERARESIAALLTETDPVVLQELIEAATRAAERQAGIAENAGQRAAGIGMRSGEIIGGALGSTTQQSVPELRQ